MGGSRWVGVGWWLPVLQDCVHHSRKLGSSKAVVVLAGVSVDPGVLVVVDPGGLIPHLAGTC